MEKFARNIFSMRMMALGMIVFLVAIAAATILESLYDIQTAKLIVYNALWFEALLVYLGINLVANIFKYRMYRREKISTFMFHLAFIVILIGAGVTRYIGFEGMMLIREGAQTDFIYSADPHLWLKINDGKVQYSYSEKKFMSKQVNNDFSIDVDFPNHKTPIEIEYVNFQKNMVDSLVTNDSIKGASLEIVTGGMKPNYLSEGGFLMVGDVALSFNKKNAMPGVEIFQQGPKMMVKTKLPMRYLPMAEMTKARQSGIDVDDSLYQNVPIDTLVPFQTTTLYQVGQEQFVFKQIVSHSKMMKVESSKKDVGADILTVRVKDGNESIDVMLEGGVGSIPEHVVFALNGLSYEMEYGSMRIPVPFAIKCRDFQLDKYPGSDMASSFASEVTVIDTINNYTSDHRIFMNNVLDYGGYRFFQSSYDPDEGGTRLSVNHDWWGTNISYLGYLMMGIGMLFSLFSPTGRFRELNQKIKISREKREKLLSVFIGVVLFSSVGFAQEHHENDGHDHSTTQEVVQNNAEPVHRIMSEEHSEKLASLLVLDFQGRIIPMHTLCDQLLRKILRENKFEEKNAVQTIMSMHMYPGYWVNADIIYVSSKGELREKFDMTGSLTSYQNLTDAAGQFKLAKEYATAHQKLESKRNEFDKQLIKLVERYQVVQSIFGWQYMKIIPLKNDPNNSWFIPLSAELMQKDSISSGLALNYLSSIDKASKDNDYSNTDKLLEKLKTFQRNAAVEFVPSVSKVAMEISYNKMSIFKNSWTYYLKLGLILLLASFVLIFAPAKEFRERKTVIGKLLSPIIWALWRLNVLFHKIWKYLKWIIVAIIVVVFLYHGYGIYMRWQISGHAPWSNGYEAVVFIAWITMLTGLFFSRKNLTILAGTAILASLMIFVTEMNLMDPEITPLQPVLKSYWLMIHVAVITGSYGPLGISCILGLLSLLLYIFRTKRNSKIVTMNISELTYVSEMTMTIGVFMLTIGTFLGGIWANESWGRYWGWDPKETWALVAVLVYAVILHLRYIPSLRNKFTFNVVSFWGYSSIIFTFFGVNFYLVGLHSYAQGVGVIPTWISWVVLVFYILTEIAWVHNQFNKSETGSIPLKVFTKKVAALSIGVAVISILVLLFGLTDLWSAIKYSAGFIGIMVLMNIVLYFYAYFRKGNQISKPSNKDVLDDE